MWDDARRFDVGLECEELEFSLLAMVGFGSIGVLSTASQR
jgi:hypothetical protein